MAHRVTAMVEEPTTIVFERVLDLSLPPSVGYLAYLGQTPLTSIREVVSLPVEALHRTDEYTEILAVGKWLRKDGLAANIVKLCENDHKLTNLMPLEGGA